MKVKTHGLFISVGIICYANRENEVCIILPCNLAFACANNAEFSVFVSIAHSFPFCTAKSQ